MKDAAKNAPRLETAPPDRERLIANGTVRWQAMGETDRAAAHARFNT